MTVEVGTKYKSPHSPNTYLVKSLGPESAKRSTPSVHCAVIGPDGSTAKKLCAIHQVDFEKKFEKVT